MSSNFDEDLLKDFFDEANTQIESIEQNLLVLEKDSADKDAVDSIFRAAHTLKGNSASVRMEEITNFTHTLEDAMDQIREGKVLLNSKIIDLLLNALDVIKNMINLRMNNEVYSEDYSAILNGLKQVNKFSSGKPEKKDKDQKIIKKDIKSEEKSGADNSYDELIKLPKFNISEYEMMEINDANHENFPLFKVFVILDETNPMRTVGGIQIFTSLREVCIVLKTIPDFEEIYSDTFHKEVLYIVASNLNADELKDYAVIPDATEKVIVIPFDMKNIKVDSTKKKDNFVKEEIKENKKYVVKDQQEDIQNDNEDEQDIQEANEEQINKYLENKFKEKDQVKEQKISSSILRVDSQKIDQLLNLVSEIVINKATYNQLSNQFGELFETFSFYNNEYKDKLKELYEKIMLLLETGKNEESIEIDKGEIIGLYKILNNKFDSTFTMFKNNINKLKSNNQNLDRISSSLQEGVMRVRMVPIQQIFNRFPRMVRDLCRDLDKDIELLIKGEDTEIDKAMIDYLMDPLIHIVRNAIDHGIEINHDREKLNKPIPAILSLSAVSQGNIISISVQDDGKGIDVDKIRKKAIEKGMIERDVIIKDQDAYNLLFEPGFSTAEKVTSISGRGVGLDVVRKNVEKLNGTIRVNSELGFGTNFTIKIPLTLAIIQGLLVKVYDQIYSIPISSVLESIKISKDEIKSIDNYEVINLRSEVLSLVRINRLFKLGNDLDSEYYFIVIVGTGDKKIGLLIDSILGEEDIVIKPLKDKYTHTPGISGATILGDGTVSLILDITQLIELGVKIEEESRINK